MLKKYLSMFLVFLLISSHFGDVISASTKDSTTESKTTSLYLISGDHEGELLAKKGSSSKADVVEQGERLTYIIEDVTGEYDGSSHTIVDLYLNDLGAAIASHAEVSFDFNGDGTWDVVEKVGEMNTAGNTSEEEYQRFSKELSSSINYENFDSGIIKLEVYPMSGESSLEVKVNAPDDASKIVLPYNFEVVEDQDEKDSELELESEPKLEPEPELEPKSESVDPVKLSDPIEVGDTFGDWTLTWHDEFDDDQLNEDNWRIDKGNGYQDDTGEFIHGWGNEERQYYQEDNVSVEDGHLVLEAREETIHVPGHGRETFHYTSGKVISDGGRFKQTYGRFEARMALPEGQGFWPAFWMMPEDSVYGVWASSGEIDIMENAGATPEKVGGAVHYGGRWPNNTHTAEDYYFPDGTDTSDFNVYALEWEPGELRWYVNDEHYWTLNNWESLGPNNPAKYAYPAPFDQDFHIVLNLAVGGWYGGDPDETTEFEDSRVLVDYVRAYELTGREYREPEEPVFEGEELPDNAKEAIDGNYVYDPNFEQGFTTLRTDSDVESNWDKNYWNFLHLEQFNGTGSASVDDLNGQSFAKVDIENGGSQTHSIQLIQDVTLATGRWYTLSFDAKSNTNRNMNVKIGGGESRGWTTYSPNRDYSLTNEVQTYEMTFQMQHDSDPAARLEFNLGTNTNPVWIGNVSLEEIDGVDPYNEEAPKQPLRDGNHVYNGTFDSGRMDRMTYWDFNTEGAEAAASVDSNVRELEVAIEDGGSTPETIKLTQKGINLLQSDEYQLIFDARATEARDIGVALMSKDGDINYSGTEMIHLSTEMEQKELTFTMGSSEDIESQLVFMLGGDDSDVTIDNVKLIRLTNHNVSLSLEDAFPLKNGDFTNELANWTEHVQGDHEPGVSEATFDVVDGELKTTVINAGWEPWHVMLSQDGMPLKKFNTYIVEFDARSTLDREIEVVVENSSYQRYFSDLIELTDTMQTFSFEFDLDVDDVVDLKFLLGNVEGGNHDIFLDNIKFEVKGEREKYFPLVNGDFSDGLTTWHEHVQGIYDGPSIASFTEEAGEAKITVEHTGNNPWDISLSQEELALYEDLTYIVEFEARSSTDRTLELVLDNGEAGGFHRYLEDVVQLTSETQTFSYELDMTSDDLVGLKFLVGAVEDIEITETHDIFIDNVRLEVKGAREVLEGNGEEPTDPDDEEPSDPGDKEWREIGENLVIDGTFDETTEFGDPDNPLIWNIHNQGFHEEWGGMANFTVVDGVVHAEIEQVGWAWWQIQLLQDIEVPAGTYKVQFDMQSDHDRDVRVELTGTGSEIQEFSVGSTMETYQAIIEVTESGQYSLMFGLGREEDESELTVPYTIKIDNVRLVEVEEVEGTDPEDPDPEEPGDPDPDPEDPENPDLTELEEIIRELQSLIDELNARLSELEEAELEAKILVLESQLEELKTKYGDLEADFSHIEKSIADLEEQLAVLQSQLAKLAETSESSDQAEDDTSKPVKATGDESNGTGGSEENEILPSTATHLFNYLVMGLVLLIIGGTLYLIRKRQTLNN
ncbi:carbohydrate binding domain-containing protein [Amphibacillus sp. Q70]|uniref:carbohydrate binding domain-containing protein n=1 Tax=Amphibacillus sp. Q70 TaxID=3453416 RepID=UPI003F834FFE